MFLNSTSAGPTCASGRTNAGSGSRCAVAPGRSWPTRVGDRSAKTCARLWAKIPSEYREKQSFSDFWKSYRPVFEEDPKSDSSNHEQVGKGSGELSHVERFFGLIRQRLSRYARETRSASQTERMLHLRTKLFVDTYNRAVT